MKLVPLEQWICDTCSKIIATPKDGAVEMLFNEQGSLADIRICHSTFEGPNCDIHRNVRSVYDEYCAGPRPLKELAGLDAYMRKSDGLDRMLSFVDEGKTFDPQGRGLLAIADIRLWTEVFRRLFLPYYEEARLYFPLAHADNYFALPHPMSLRDADTLRELIEKYSGK